MLTTPRAKAALGFALKEARFRGATLETLRVAILGTGSVELARRVVEGRAAEAVVDESRRGDLLAVGSRGDGGFAGLLLGRSASPAPTAWPGLS